MAKLTLTDLANLQNETTAVAAVNANNGLIETALENTLSRDGTSPNTMTAQLDMNSNRIINLPAPVGDNDAARFVDIGDAPGYAEDAAASAAAALVSETAAAASASSASASVTAAQTAETNAETAETNAETAETNAETAATNAAASATVVAGNFYNFDSSTSMADPGSGDVRFNHATLASVTALAFSVNTADTGAPSIRTYLSTWGSSSTALKGIIQIRKVGTPATFAIFNVTASVTDNTTWEQVTVAYVSGNGTFSAADQLSVQFSRSGSDGALSGPGASVDSEIALWDGAAGTALKRATTTGILKATSGVISAAVSATDYAPATTGSSILKASSGGFASAVSGTDYAPATTGSSILKASSGGFANATAGTDYYNPGGTDVAVADGGTGSSTAAGALTNLSAAGQGKQTIYIPATAMLSRTTNGPSVGTVELSTNKIMVKSFDFDTTTQEFAQFHVWFPKSWNLGTVTFQPCFSQLTTAAGGVVFGLAGVAVSTTDDLDAAFGTAQTSTTTAGTLNKEYQGPESAAITIAGTPTAGDRVVFQINRTVADASDTLAQDARLHGIRLFYTTNAATDA